MRYLLASLVTLSILSVSAHANSFVEISHIEITEEEALTLDESGFSSVMTDEPVSSRKNVVASIMAAGEVIRVARDLVALGEEVYVLVQKGKPNLQTEYAPLSVLAKEGGRAVDAMDMEGWRMPVVKTVNVAFKNIYGIAMAALQYKIIFSYGGSYNGKGAYIAGAQLVPSKAHAYFGVDFNVKMRVSGITNHGTRAKPVAGATMHIQYKASTILNTIERSDTYHITGLGQIKKL